MRGMRRVRRVMGGRQQRRVGGQPGGRGVGRVVVVVQLRVVVEGRHAVHAGAAAVHTRAIARAACAHAGSVHAAHAHCLRTGRGT